MDFCEKRNNVHETHLTKEPVSKDGKAREKKTGGMFSPRSIFSRPGAAPARKRILSIVARLDH